MRPTTFLDSVFSKDELIQILDNENVVRKREQLIASNMQKIGFSFELPESMRTKLITSLGLSTNLPLNVPMTWMAHDSSPHIDTCQENFEDTIIVYISDNSGSLIIENESYNIQENRAFKFPKGVSHYTENTASYDSPTVAPRLMIGPMSETGIPVGGPTVYYFAESTYVLPEPNFEFVVYSSVDLTISGSATFPDSSSISPPTPGLTLLSWAGLESIDGVLTEITYNLGDTWPSLYSTYLYPVWSTPIVPPTPITLYYFTNSATMSNPPVTASSVYSEIKDLSLNPQYISATNVLPGDIVISPPTPGQTLYGWQGLQYEVIDNEIVYSPVSYIAGDLWSTVYNTYLYPVWTIDPPPTPITLYYFTDSATMSNPPVTGSAVYSEIKDPSETPQYISATNVLPGDIVISPPTPGLDLLGWQGLQYEVVDNEIVYSSIAYSPGDLWSTLYNTYLYPVWSTPNQPPLPITLYYFTNSTTMSNPPVTASAVYSLVKNASIQQYVSNSYVLPNYIMNSPTPGYALVKWIGVQYEIINDDVVYTPIEYGLGELWPAVYNTYLYPVWERIMCFKEDTKILCLEGEIEIYMPIQDIKNGTLVKTLSSGYQPVSMIGKSKIYNPANNLRCKNRLFKCSKENYPEIIDDLYITGCHSILVDHISDKEREDCIEIMGKIYVTENRYRMMACIDERAQPYEEEGLYTIWHLALAHDDYRMNYGIYANGLLVETSSKRMMAEYSGMELL